MISICCFCTWGTYDGLKAMDQYNSCDIHVWRKHKLKLANVHLFKLHTIKYLLWILINCSPFSFIQNTKMFTSLIGGLRLSLCTTFNQNESSQSLIHTKRNSIFNYIYQNCIKIAKYRRCF